jgi:hypothetical protein
MNHTVAYKIYTAPASRSNDQDHESFLRKNVAWLNTILMSCRPKKSTRFQHKSFMDANLLDDVMGPEISRTLRR